MPLPHGLRHLNTWPQLVALFGDLARGSVSLGMAFQKEELGSTCSLLSLLHVCGWGRALSFLRFPPGLLLPPAALPPCQGGLLVLWNCKPSDGLHNASGCGASSPEHSFIFAAFLPGSNPRWVQQLLFPGYPVTQMQKLPLFQFSFSKSVYSINICWTCSLLSHLLG